MSDDDLYLPMAFSVKEAARQFGLKESSIHNFIKSGRILAVRTGDDSSRLIVPRSEMLRFIVEGQERERLRAEARKVKRAAKRRAKTPEEKEVIDYEKRYFPVHEEGV